MDNFKEFSIIIPVAGIGKRMKSYGPKCLILLDNTNILGRQLNILQELYPKSDIVIVTGFEHNKINNFVNEWKFKRVLGSKEVKTIHNKHYEDNNVAKSISIATEYCDKNKYLIVYGDLVFNKETLSEIEWDKSGVLLDKNHQFYKDEIGILKNEDKISTFCYGSDIKWSQICYLEENEMESYLNFMDDENRNKFFSFEIFNLMLEEGIDFQEYYSPNSKIVEVDYSKDITKARNLVKGKL
jgi:choline kinase